MSKVEARRVDVAIIGAVGQLSDPEVLGEARTVLRDELRFHPEHEIDALERVEAGARVEWRADGADGDAPLLHVAADGGKTAGGNAGSYPDVKRSEPNARLSVTFSDPQISVVGKGRRVLSAGDGDFGIGEVRWADQGRAQVLCRNHGLTRLYGERGTGRLLGAEMIGPASQHLAHLLAWSIDRGETAADMLAIPFITPASKRGCAPRFATSIIA